MADHVTFDVQSGSTVSRSGAAIRVAGERAPARSDDVKGRPDDAPVTVGDLRRLGLVDEGGSDGEL